MSSCVGGGATKSRSASSAGSISQGEVVDLNYTKYAKGYSVKQYGDMKLVEITDPIADNSTVYKYALVARGDKSAKIPEGYSKIEVPLKNIICMTTLQLSPFIKLKATDRIVGITSTKFLQNRELNERLKSRKIARIGIEGEFDTEVVLSLDADMIMISPYKRGGYDSIKSLDIPMLAYLGYKESTPLGQAEWVKLVGLLLGLDEQAEAEFAAIETRYHQLVDLVKDVDHRPEVLSGELHSGNWYVVGGKSYLAQLFRDAGADYFMENDNESGGFYVDYETVYSKGYDADFWRIVNSFNGDYSYEDIIASDSRYLDFKPLRDKKVIYCNLRRSPFYENTPMEPEVLLADLIKIFHPGRLDDHRAVYYELLE